MPSLVSVCYGSLTAVSLNTGYLVILMNISQQYLVIIVPYKLSHFLYIITIKLLHQLTIISSVFLSLLTNVPVRYQFLDAGIWLCVSGNQHARFLLQFHAQRVTVTAKCCLSALLTVCSPGLSGVKDTVHKLKSFFLTLVEFTIEVSEWEIVTFSAAS